MSRDKKAFIGGLLTVFAIVCASFAWHIWHVDLSERLCLATAQGDRQAMIRLLDSGADVDFLFMGTTSSLQEAIDNNDPAAAAILMKHGASKSLLDSHYLRLLYAPSFRSALAREHYVLKD